MSNPQDRAEFLEMELAYVRTIRKTRNPKLLKLVSAAVEREQAIIQEIEAAHAEAEPLLAHSSVGGAR